MDEVEAEAVTPGEAGLSAADLMVVEPRTIAVPGTGEVVDASDPVACARALDGLRGYEALVKEAKRELTAAIHEQAAVLGTKTLPLGGGVKATLGGGPEAVWDAEGLERDLRAAGMPEERIREIVKEEVTYKVAAGEAKRAAGANPAYAAAVEANRTMIDKPVYVSFKR